MNILRLLRRSRFSPRKIRYLPHLFLLKIKHFPRCIVMNFRKDYLIAPGISKDPEGIIETWQNNFFVYSTFWCCCYVFHRHVCFIIKFL